MQFTVVLTCTNEQACVNSITSLSQLKPADSTVKIILLGHAQQAPLLQQLVNLGPQGAITAIYRDENHGSLTAELNQAITHNLAATRDEVDRILFAPAGILFEPDFLEKLTPFCRADVDIIKVQRLTRIAGVRFFNNGTFDTLRTDPYAFVSGLPTVVYRHAFLLEHGLAFSDQDTYLSTLFMLEAARTAAARSSSAICCVKSAQAFPSSNVVNPVPATALPQCFNRLYRNLQQDQVGPEQRARFLGLFIIELLQYSRDLTDLQQRLNLVQAISALYDQLTQQLPEALVPSLQAGLSTTSQPLTTYLAQHDLSALFALGDAYHDLLIRSSISSWRQQGSAYERYYRELQSFVTKPRAAQCSDPIYVVSPLCHLPGYDEMYERYFKGNAFLTCYEHIHLEPIYTEPFDGYLTRTYNSFLERYDYSRPAWLVFVHGDYEITCDLDALLAHEDKDQLLGPVGAVLKEINGQPLSVFACFNDSQRRDGSYFQGGPCNQKLMGDEREVDTFDSCCLVVHSSLVQRCHLRFDESIVLDFIVEDFCANARLNHGIKSKLIELCGIHHTNSTGMPDTQSQRFYDTQAYIAQKYPDVCLGGACSFIGGAAPNTH